MDLRTTCMGLRLRPPLIVSACQPLSGGIDKLRLIETDIRHWMEQPECEPVGQMQDRTSRIHCSDPGASERARYMRAPTSDKPQGCAP